MVNRLAAREAIKGQKRRSFAHTTPAKSLRVDKKTALFCLLADPSQQVRQMGPPRTIIRAFLRLCSPGTGKPCPQRP